MIPLHLVSCLNSRAARRDIPFGHRRFLTGQVHQKFGAMPRTLAVGFRATAVHFNETLDQRQPDPQATVCSGKAVVVLVKKVEYIRQHILGYTHSIIVNANGDPLIRCINVQTDALAGV